MPSEPRLSQNGLSQDGYGLLKLEANLATRVGNGDQSALGLRAILDRAREQDAADALAGAAKEAAEAAARVAAAEVRAARKRKQEQDRRDELEVEVGRGPSKTSVDTTTVALPEADL